jgi:hypothetical protein
MICQYCREDKRLIKAHIIPEAFFRRIRGEQNSLRLISNKENEYSKRAPIGVYDRNILCIECERIFGTWDNYAQDFLNGVPQSATPIRYGNSIIGYEVPYYNYATLKLFFISLLWRAGISKHSFYAKVKLGPYEALLRNYIAQKNPGTGDEFAVTLAKFNYHLVPFFDPHPEKFEAINYYRFYLGSYVAYIKIDKRQSPKFHSEVMLKPNAPLLIIGRELEGSKEFSLMKKIAAIINNHFKTPASQVD